MKILALDTATEACSAALLIDQQLLRREPEPGRGQGERILNLVDELLREAHVSLGELDAIAFGRGPGGFTGVRLAASVTQGLAFGAGVPVVPVSDLQALAQRVLSEDSALLGVVVCNDARMQEVYWGCFERGVDGLAHPVSEERVGAPATVMLPGSWSGAIAGAGRGFAAYPQLRSGLGDRLATIRDGLLPRAHEIAVLAAPVVRSGGALPAEQALPVYVRNEVAQAAKSSGI